MDVKEKKQSRKHKDVPEVPGQQHQHHSQRGQKERQVDQCLFAETVNQPSDEHRLHHCADQGSYGNEYRDIAGGVAVLMIHEQREDRFKIGKAERQRENKHQQDQIRRFERFAELPPDVLFPFRRESGRLPLLDRPGLLKQAQGKQHREAAYRRRYIEWCANAKLGKKTADPGTDDKAQRHRGAQHPKTFAPALFAGNVGYIRQHSGNHGRGPNASDQTRNVQLPHLVSNSE